MAALTDSKPDLIAGEDEKHGVETNAIVHSSSKAPPTIEVTRLPDDTDDNDSTPTTTCHSTYHIYTEKECYKVITPVLDSTKERRPGPTLKQQKADRLSRKERKASGLPPIEPAPNTFFLHRPYLAFHMPPRVLYTGNSRHGTHPAVLVHEACLWRTYKLQLGPSIARPGVLDPRGVVAWRHNGGDKPALKSDAHKLKGYKVRTWRLWGETGKKYVHCVKRSRLTGEASDPDVIVVGGGGDSNEEKAVRAEEVVNLRWTSPFSRQTRRYSFSYRGVDFVWKGTGTVRESRRCGMFLRFNHLKLVAKVPLASDEKDRKKSGEMEICLGKFTSSVAKQKNGTLELYDAAILRLVEEYMPSLLADDPFEDEVAEIVERRAEGETENDRVARLKKSTLYQVIMATAMCMIMSEKEKRHTLLDFIMQAGEGGGGAG